VSRGDGTIEFGKSVRMVSPYLSFGELDAGDVDLLDTVHLIEPDYLALSFAEQANAVRDLRERVAGWPVRVLAKIETTRGLINAEQLARAADGLMLGRDDLSLRVSASGLSEAAEELARLARQHGKEFVAASGYFSSVAAGCECSETDLRELRAVARYADWVVSDETAFAELPLEVINLARSTGLLGEGGPR
jgi:pyruvate kinase